MKTKTKNIIIFICSFILASNMVVGTIAMAILQIKYGKDALLKSFYDAGGYSENFLLGAIVVGVAIATPILYNLIRVEGQKQA